METPNPNQMSSQTVRERLKRDLLLGIRVSPLYGLQHYQTMDLRKRLSELRIEDEMEIDSEWVTNPDTGKKYKVHFMTQESINNYLSKHHV